MIHNAEWNTCFNDNPKLSGTYIALSPHPPVFPLDTRAYTAFQFFGFERPFLDAYLRALVSAVHEPCKRVDDVAAHCYARKCVVEEILLHPALSETEKTRFVEATADYLWNNEFDRILQLPEHVMWAGALDGTIAAPSRSAVEPPPPQRAHCVNFSAPAGATHDTVIQVVLPAPLPLRNSVTEQPAPGVLARIVFGYLDRGVVAPQCWKRHHFQYATRGLADLTYDALSPHTAPRTFITARVTVVFYDGVREPITLVFDDCLFDSLASSRVFSAPQLKGFPRDALTLFWCATIDILAEEVERDDDEEDT